MLIKIDLYHLIALKMYNTDADIPEQRNKCKVDDNNRTQSA